MMPITATQIVDVDTFTVQVHAAPTPELVTRLCRDLDRYSGRRLMVAHLAADNPEHQRALRELQVALADTFTWILTASQTDEIGSQLYEAGTLPEQCAYDESFSVTKVEGVEMCQAHANAYNVSDADNISEWAVTS